MLGSYRLLRQMAQVSVQMAHDHMATAFHFLISKRLPLFEPLAGFVLGPASAAAAAAALVSVSISTSDMVPT